jgi:hypothetical protein
MTNILQAKFYVYCHHAGFTEYLRQQRRAAGDRLNARGEDPAQAPGHWPRLLLW